MHLKNIAIKDINVYNLKTFTNPSDLNEVKLFCSVRVSNEFLKPMTRYKLILKFKNFLEKRPQKTTNDILIKKINQQNNSKKILDSFVFTKSYSSSLTNKEKDINFDIVIRKDEIAFDESSSFFSKGVFLINAFLTTEKNLQFS